jgi:hypothetical protein
MEGTTHRQDGDLISLLFPSGRKVGQKWVRYIYIYIYIYPPPFVACMAQWYIFTCYIYFSLHHISHVYKYHTAWMSMCQKEEKIMSSLSSDNEDQRGNAWFCLLKVPFQYSNVLTPDNLFADFSPTFIDFMGGLHELRSTIFMLRRQYYGLKIENCSACNTALWSHALPSVMASETRHFLKSREQPLSSYRNVSGWSVVCNTETYQR